MHRKSTVIRAWGLAGLLTTVLLLGGAGGPPVAQAVDIDPSYYTHDVQVLFEEMTLVQVVAEETFYADTVCAGVGLNNVKPSPDGPMILVPNAGDLSAGGSNVSVKLHPDGEISFVPRVQGQRIRVPMDVGDKVAGQEVLSLTLDEGIRLMVAGQLVWTYKDKGPYGNGHGIAGHIALCDPRYVPTDDEDLD
jgi:hypothetical protein